MSTVTYAGPMGQAALPRRMSRKDRRAALLDAAGQLLRRRRRTPLTFEAIAAEAGVSATLPYKYFDAIDDVARDLYRQVVSAVDDETDELLADPQRSFDDKVRASLHLWADTIRRDGRLLLRLADGEAHPSLAAVISRRRERAVDVWAAQVEAEFGLDEPTARLVAASLTAGSSAVLQRWTRDRIDLDRAIDVFVTMARAQAESLVGR